MNEEELKKYLEYKELGVTILSGVYIGLILVIYITIGAYISDVDNSEQSIYQSIVPLIITGIIGGFSKGFYFSLVDLIFDNCEELVTEKVKRNNRKIEGLINYITILLLLRFLINMNTNENIFLNIAVIAIGCLSGLMIISFYFKFTPYTIEDLRKKK